MKKSSGRACGMIVRTVSYVHGRLISLAPALEVPRVRLVRTYPRVHGVTASHALYKPIKMTPAAGELYPGHVGVLYSANLEWGIEQTHSDAKSTATLSLAAPL